jgi:hypothetical protein
MYKSCEFDVHHFFPNGVGSIQRGRKMVHQVAIRQGWSSDTQTRAVVNFSPRRYLYVILKTARRYSSPERLGSKCLYENCDDKAASDLPLDAAECMAVVGMHVAYE